MGTYSRFPSGRKSWDSYVTPAIRNLVIACAAVFAVQTALGLFDPPALGWMDRVFGLMPLGYGFLRPGYGFLPWQPLTYLFLHGGIWHLLFNMLFLWMFGVDLERAWGSHRLYTYFFLTGVGAALITIVVKATLATMGFPPSPIPTIGASGAIYAILLASAVVFPDRKIWLIPFPVTIPMKIYVIGAIALEFFATLGASGDNVAHVTHLGGILIGYLYLRRGSWFFRVRNGVSDWQRKRARRKFEVYMRKNRDQPPSSPDRWVN